MKLRLLTGLILVASLIAIGCDPDRGKTPVANNAVDNSASSTVTPTGLVVGPEVGNLAPEIEGVDLDGVEFKLSDYRGKVVMLDFYGDW